MSSLNFPPSVCHRVTRRCNAACAFCQAPNNSRDHLTVDEIGRVASLLRERGVRSMKLTGGEPTIRRDIAEVVGAIAEAGLKPVVLTNGISIGEDLLATAVRVGAEFKVSIHRDSAENDRVLRVRSFDRIQENLARLRAAGVVYSIMTVVEPGEEWNVARMTEFARNNGARKVSFIPMVPRGRALRLAGAQFSESGMDLIREQVTHLSSHSGGTMRISLIDFRSHDYWVIENDGSLWVERWRDDLDERLLDKTALLGLGAGSVGR
jgi:molybdenum cofactor biosynthesis enzyme MoaA